MKFYDRLINESLPGARQAVPAVTTVPSAEYPRVYADGRAIFRVHLPFAKAVQLEGGRGLCAGPVPMIRESDGHWTVTVPPAVTGFHYYWFNVDGVVINDPGSEIFFGYHKETGGIEIPDPQFISSDLVTAPATAFYAPDEGPQGQLHEHRYLSKATGAWRRCIVYTPPGYHDDASARTRYPVLYLQHGAGENETGWSRQGAVNFILDNAIKGTAAGPFAAFFGGSGPKAKPMIAVMDSGYATYRDGMAPEHRDPSEEHLAMYRDALEAFGTVVIHELIPLVDLNYRSVADREHRAMAGLSMGGMQAMAIALTHLDTFAYIGTFSGSQFTNPITPSHRDGQSTPPFDPKSSYGGIFADAAAFNSKVRLLWFGAGTAELSFCESLRANAGKLRAWNIKVVDFYSPGTAHEWQTWRICLKRFATQLFRA